LLKSKEDLIDKILLFVFVIFGCLVISYITFLFESRTFNCPLTSYSSSFSFSISPGVGEEGVILPQYFLKVVEI
jgi:hypothetical protein